MVAWALECGFSLAKAAPAASAPGTPASSTGPEPVTPHTPQGDRRLFETSRLHLSPRSPEGEAIHVIRV